MKNIRLITIPIIALGLLMFNGCAKENTPTTNKFGNIQCKVNGTDWVSMPGGGYGYMDDPSHLEIFGLQIKGTDTSCVGIALSLTPNKLGLYEGETKIFDGGYVLYYPNTDQTQQINILVRYKTTYKVELTKLDLENHKVSGTFSNVQIAPSGQGLPDYIITEGRFTDLYLEN